MARDASLVRTGFSRRLPRVARHPVALDLLQLLDANHVPGALDL